MLLQHGAIINTVDDDAVHFRTCKEMAHELQDNYGVKNETISVCTNLANYTVTKSTNIDPLPMFCSLTLVHSLNYSL